MSTTSLQIMRELGWVLVAILSWVANASAAEPSKFATTPLRIPETMQRVMSLAFSPDGKYLLSGHGSPERNGSVQIWEVATGRRVALHVLPSGVSTVRWFPQGDKFAFSTWDNRICVFEFPALKPGTEFRVKRSVGYQAVAPDGQRIVTVTEGERDADESPGRVVQIWDASSGELVRQCDTDEAMFRMSSTDWSPKGNYVAGAGGYYGRQIGIARLWFSDTGKVASTLEGHTGYIRAIKFFPDDKQVATSGLDGTVRIWESATGKQVAQLAIGSPVDGLDISSDGTILASGSAKGEISLWSRETTEKIADLAKSGPTIHSLALSPNAALLAAGGVDGIVRLWNVSERKLERELPLLGSDDRPGAPQAMAALADGQLAVVAYDTGVLLATDVTNRKIAWRFATEAGQAPTAISVSADRKRLLVGYEDGAVHLHSVDDGKVQAELKRMPARVASVALDVESGLFAAGDTEGRVWLWESDGKGVRSERKDHGGKVLALAFAEKGDVLVSIGADGKGIRRKTGSDEVVAEERLAGSPLVSASISQDGSTVATLGSQLLVVWNGETFQRRSNFRVANDMGTSVVLSAEGDLGMLSQPQGTALFDATQKELKPALATASREQGLVALSSDRRAILQATSDGALLVWRAEAPQFKPLGSIARTGNAVALATSPDGKWLVAGGDDSQATVWDLSSGEIVATLPGNFGTMYAIAFSADSSRLATANLTGTVKVWRVADWSLENVRHDAKRQVRSLAFSPSGRWLAVGSNDRKLIVVDTEDWETVAEEAEQDLWVEGVAFSPDGTLLYSVTGSWDPNDQPVTATLTAWKVMAAEDTFKLRPVRRIKAHRGSTDNLVVTPDGRHVVTGGTDRRLNVWDAKSLELVRSSELPVSPHRLHLLASDPSQVVVGDHQGGVSVWDLRTGQCLRTYAGHTGHVFDVSATKDGRMLISAGEDDRLLFWPGPTDGPDMALRQFLRTAIDETP